VTVGAPGHLVGRKSLVWTVKSNKEGWKRRSMLQEPRIAFQATVMISKRNSGKQIWARWHEDCMSAVGNRTLIEFWKLFTMLIRRKQSILGVSLLKIR
jgi:hypothetical protein